MDTWHALIGCRMIHGKISSSDTYIDNYTCDIGPKKVGENEHMTYGFQMKCTSNMWHLDGMSQDMLLS